MRARQWPGGNSGLIAMAGDNQAAHIPCQGDGGGRHVVQFKRRRCQGTRVAAGADPSRQRAVASQHLKFSPLDVISPRSCEHLDLVAGACGSVGTTLSSRTSEELPTTTSR